MHHWSLGLLDYTNGLSVTRAKTRAVLKERADARVASAEVEQILKELGGRLKPLPRRALNILTVAFVYCCARVAQDTKSIASSQIFHDCCHSRCPLSHSRPVRLAGEVAVAPWLRAADAKRRSDQQSAGACRPQCSRRAALSRPSKPRFAPASSFPLRGDVGVHALRLQSQ